MRLKILLTLAFPGIIQISEGNLKIGIPLVVLNWVFLYTLWPILMPISLGLILKKEKDDKINSEKEDWKQELTQILTAKRD